MKDKKLELRHLVLELGLFVLTFSLISYFYHSNLLLTLILLFTGGIGIFFWHTKKDITLFVVSAILGPLAEIVCIKFGVWTYSKPVFLGIPPWLPIAWGEAVVFFYKLSNFVYLRVVDRKKK